MTTSNSGEYKRIRNKSETQAEHAAAGPNQHQNQHQNPAGGAGSQGRM